MDAIKLTGVIRGRTIELDQGLGLPDGSRVSVHIRLAPGEGIKFSAGSWADAGPELDESLKKIYEMRHTGRSIIEP